MNFKTTPYAHQLEAFNRSCDQPAFAYFMEMGTGKSKVLIDNIAYLYYKSEINAAIIFAPKGAYRNWTNIELGKHMPDDITMTFAYWTPNPKKDEKDALLSVLQQGSDTLKVLVMNTESLSTTKGTKFAQQFLMRHHTLMAIDESTGIKNYKAKRTKAALNIGRRAKYRRILTGEPVTKSPLDLYSQMAFLNPNIIGHTSFYSFRNRYAILKQRYTNARTFTEVTGYKNIEELQARIQIASYRVRKETCLDLPPKIYTTREVELTAEQKKIYKDLVKRSRAELTEKGKFGVVSTPMVITKILRLHQVVCGTLKDDNGELHSINSNRVKSLMELLEEVDGNVIIWCNYIADIHNISNALSKEYGPESVVPYYGAVSSDDRVEAVDRFQSGEAQFFVGQSRTGGFGLTLTKATTVIYFSNNYDLEVRLQSEDRAHRIGQDVSVTYVDMISPGTIDEKIIQALKAKRNLSTKVMGDDWRDWIK